MRTTATDPNSDLRAERAPPHTQQAWRRRAAGIAGLLVLGAAVWMAWFAEQPPPPLPATAPASVFSVERAWRHLERIAGDEPTPIGSAGGDAIRDYLVTQFAALGLDVEIQTGVGAHAFSEIIAGRVENVVATLSGSDSTGRLLLAAHYDSTPTTPGTSDDKASVAAILEIARVLTDGPQPRNDVVFLLSDGEEPGLIGAEAFARQHPLAADGGVMINLEGPGNSGPSALFNTSSGNAALIGAFSGSVPHPFGESAVSEVYRMGEFNTDFTVLRESGFIGLEFGPIDGRAYYHHPQDTVDNLDRAGLQHHGTNALALTGDLAGRDLPDLRSTQDASFFTAFGQVVHYPSTLVWPIAVVAVLAVVALGVLARARGLASAPHLLMAIAAAALPIVIGPLAAMGWWRLLVWIRPGYAHLMSNEPYRPELYRWALAMLTVAVVVAWYLALRRRIGSDALAIGVLAWPAAFGVAMAALVPGMSYYGALGTTASAAGMAVGMLVRRRWPAGQVVALTLGVLPGVVLWSIGGRVLVSVLGVGLGAAGALYFVMAVLTALPVLGMALPQDHGERQETHRRRVVAVPAALLLVTVVLSGGGLAVDQFDEDHPEAAYLMYIRNADTDTAMWATVDDHPHPWAAEYVPDARVEDPLTVPLPHGITLTRTGPAEPAPLAAPELTLLDSRTKDGFTVVRLRARSRRDAYALGVHIDRPVRDATLHVAGHPQVLLPAPEAPGDPAPWPWEVQFFDPPPEGIELTLRMRGTRPPRIGITDWTNGLEGLPGYTDRPSTVDKPPSGPPTDSVVVTRVARP